MFAFVAITGAFFNGSAINSKVIFGGILYCVLIFGLSAPGVVLSRWTNDKGILAILGIIGIFFIPALAAMILCWWALGRKHSSVFQVSAWLAFSVVVGISVFFTGAMCAFGI
jgi:hypothetical protein